MQLIDKDKVEEIIRNLWKEDDGHNPEHRICYNKALQEVQCEIDTLDAKEVDLNEEISKFIETYYSKAKLGHKLSIRRAAAYFYKLGLKAQKGEEV